MRPAAKRGQASTTNPPHNLELTMSNLNKLIPTLIAASLLQAFAAPAHAVNQAEMASHVASEKAKMNIYRAKFPSLALAHKAAISFHANLLEAKYETGYMVLDVNPEEKA
jgi:hypothetical protein